MLDSLPVATSVAGKPDLLLGAYDLASVGYAAAEFFISGTATSFTPDAELDSSGQWSVTPSGTADYTTRMVVVTPTDATRFNGTVLVEWLNVSGGIDAPAVWFMAHREVIREGYAYIAVSAQQVGVEGGTSMGLGFDLSLKAVDPARYGRLHHPGDAFAYDIFSQAGQLARVGANVGILGSLVPKHVLALGESQSAFFLTSYVNAVDPLAQVYDGFVIHSRFGPAAPLDGVSIFEPSSVNELKPVRFRPDLRVPLITIITETDLTGGHRMGYSQARQPDNERLRVWEIPGTAHADNYTIQVAWIDTGSAPLDDLVTAYSPTDILLGQQIDHFINFAPQHHYVLQGALNGLHTWVRTGQPPPSAPDIDLTDDDPPQLALDDNGLAKGGIRTPWVDVPIARTTGVSEEEVELERGLQAGLSWLFGISEPFGDATLRQLYPGGAAEYLDRFTVALDSAIGSGFIVPADRQEILDIAAATYAAASS